MITGETTPYVPARTGADQVKNTGRWAPGQSGNPNGRPRGHPDARPRIRALLAEIMAGNREQVRTSLRAALRNPKLAVNALELYARLNPRARAARARAGGEPTAPDPDRLHPRHGSGG
jgi:Family of unknown function (DUF5681)